MFAQLLAFTLLTFVGIQPVTAHTQIVTPLPKTNPSPTPTTIPTPLPTATPTPTPKPTATPTPTAIPAPTDINSLFSKYADTYHTDSELLKRIAKCESGFNTNAENGPYAGMFQFAQSTWTVTRIRMGENSDPNLRKNAEEAIKTAAYVIGNGGQNAWINCL